MLLGVQDPQNCRAFAIRQRSPRTHQGGNAQGHHAEVTAVLSFLEHSLRMRKEHVATIQRIQNPRLWFNFAVRR